MHPESKSKSTSRSKQQRQDPNAASPSLLSPAGYDDDASSLRSLSEQDSDSEDDEFLRNSRSTLELTEHDRSVLEEEEERVKLLTRGGAGNGLRRIFTSSPQGSVRIGKKDRRRRRREAAARRLEEEGGDEGERGRLVYEMEERPGCRDSDEDGDEDEDEMRRGGTPLLERGSIYSQVNWEFSIIMPIM